MEDSFLNLEDEVLPSFLSSSLDSTSGRATLGNVTLGSGPGLPVAASTVAKVRAGPDNRGDPDDASYLEGGQLSLANLQTSNGEQAKFAFSFKGDLDNMDDFIAAHRFPDMLTVHLDETGSKTKGAAVLPPTKSDLVHGRPTEQGTDLSTGLLSFSQFGHRDVTNAKALCLSTPANEDSPDSEGADSDRFSGSVSSFLANEKLMSVDSMNSDLTDDDIDMNNMPDDELELYFNKLIPPALQRGRVEGQELPAAGLPGANDSMSNPSSTEPEKRRRSLDDYEEGDFQMPDVRLAATGMDSCPASDEDTEDELEAARRSSSTARTRLLLLHSTSRQLVGESHRPSFRPGLEGGSSDDEPSSGRSGPSQSGIEHRRSAEGQVINPPVTGDGGDGSSGSEESGSDGGASAVPAQSSGQTTYDVLRGLGIVGSSGVGQDGDGGANGLLALGRNGLPRRTEMGDRVGPVGTGEATGGPQRLSPVNWSMTLDRQEALDAMDSTQSGPVVETGLDSVYLRNGAGSWRPQDNVSHLQGTQSSFYLSQMVPHDDGGVDEADGARFSLGLRGGPCGNATAKTGSTDGTSEDDYNLMSTSLEPKYFSQGSLPEQEDSDDAWSNCPNNLEVEFQQGATQSVVYQNEEGKWVTDLAYYSSFEKEVDGNVPEDAGQFQTEDFVPACNAIEKIIEDQVEFEKEHQFMQEEQIEAATVSPPMADSWKLPTSSHILMRASQVSSEFERANQSYLRLSLGEFFGQRSEALGCLGNDDMDWVKRPSFGYVITSPEKREPFALIRPSDFASRDTSVHNTVELDKTLTQDELDKTLNAPVDRMSPKGDADPEPCAKEDEFNPGDPLQSSDGPGSTSHSADSPHNTTNLMLSISTIASAIADASISSDPSQLAAMIMELSKQSRAKNRSDAAKPMGAAASTTDEQTTVQHSDSEVDHSALLNTLQRSACAGELSAFDIEKYLRKVDASGASDASVAHMTLDLTSLVDNLRNSPRGFPAEARSVPAQPVEVGTQQRVKAEDQRQREEAVESSAAESVSRSNSVSCVNKGDPSRRSSIPRPKASGILMPAPGSRRRSVGQPSTVKPAVSSNTSSHTSQKSEHSSAAAASPSGPATSSVLKKGRSGLPCLRGPSPPSQRSTGRQHDDTPEKRAAPRSPVAALQPHSFTGKHVGFTCQSPQPPAHRTFEVFKSSSEPPACDAEETRCTFRPSTSPLTHSSPSQTSFPSTAADSTVSSPSSSGGLEDRRPGCELSPQSTCSSPSLSRLTYISINDSTVTPTPQKQKSDLTMALSTTIIRASPTPPVEADAQSSFDHLGPSKPLDRLHQSKSLDPLPHPPPPPQCNSPERSCSSLSCTRSQSERAYHRCGGSLPPGQACGQHLSKVDSGYSSNLNVQQQYAGNAAPHNSQQWGTCGSGPAPRALAMPPPYSSEEMRYVPISSFKPQADGGLLSGHSLFTAQMAQARQYLGSDAVFHPGPYHTGAASNFYTVSAPALSGGEPSVRRLHTSTGAPGVLGPAGFHPLHRPHQSPIDLAMMGMGKPYGGVEPWVPSGLDEIRGQVVVPEELRFPHACCVGIASQTSLSLFNPSERWQQVSITVSSLAIDGEKVDSLPYQWLMVKTKTIIGPRSTEEQKVLLIPPQAGIYQCVFSVSSWPASSGPDLAARAEVFAKRVLLVAMAENPAIEVDVGKSGCLDFGDLSGGGAKSLALKLLNRTHATVPIRLVISANATAWRCFTFSKTPVAMTAEGVLQAGHVTQLSSPSVMNHIMHASYGENPESFMVWVLFRAPQKYTASSGDLGPADEYSARVDIEVDSPGPSQVIRSVHLKARSGTARVHAPKDLQTVSLSAALGKSSQQTLPLKNAGNIDVELKLKISDTEECFMVSPDELSLGAGEEQCIVVTFSAQKGKKCRESLLSILVLPWGPQYEVALKGEVIPEDCGKAAPPSSAVSLAPQIASDVLPILSNKQFVAWGGVTLGRAVQQKLVLRNNSANTTQQLRLLIRGQDQDCFQLQSMFSPEERLTRHGELSIWPLEDVAVHLLFAPTRVACMLAKLEIKQSRVRPSQPGVKFTIPLSGYGGTSNIILEDQQKQADGYVAVLVGIAVGRVSKVCLCVRNTGSRAAFIKAAAYSNIQARCLMASSVISLSPSQFVLKERTQEVITVLMKSTQREQALCQSAKALLATVCLFCGDEVSRQQYRRLLQNKPDAASKVLSENSLLKHIDFNEKFLGEEEITEACDLPQRPNEAQIFYGNMSKVVLSLLGSTATAHTEEGIGGDTLQPPVGHGSETDGNVSLDVLPVKGPQGLALKVSDPSLKAAGPTDKPQESWSIQPDQIVLTAPTINGASMTRHVHINNNTSRELSFELSWPAHCLTITPQHGVIEPHCHLQILISPNPSLATKASLLPWSGQIYIQCAGQQKFIKVQIRRDLALDVSATPADRSLLALAPQAATPLLPVVRPHSRSPQAPRAAPTLVEIRNRTVVFPVTPSGETSDAHLEVENGDEEVRWYLSSFAPPYVKGVDGSGDVYRATYTAFRCSMVSGTLGAHQKMQVPITFLPRDRGDYAQFWDLECHPVSDPQQKTGIRFQLCGTGVKSGPVEGPHEGDCSLVKTEASIKTRKRADSGAVKTGPEEVVRRGVYLPQELYTFPATRVAESSSLKVNIRNNSSATHELKFVNPREPFYIKHSKYSLRSQHYLKMPVQFKPTAAGRHTGLLLVQSETSESLVIQLTGEAFH